MEKRKTEVIGRLIINDIIHICFGATGHACVKLLQEMILHNIYNSGTFKGPCCNITIKNTPYRVVMNHLFVRSFGISEWS